MLSALFLAVYVTTATTQKFMSTPSTFWRPTVGTTSLRPWQIPNPVSSVPWQIPIPKSEAPFSFWYPPSARGQPNYLMANLLPERGAADFVTMEQPTVETSRSNMQSIRLPSTLKPLHYLVKLQPFINGNSSVFGYVEVEMEVLEPTSNITLHMADIITKNDTVKISSRDDPGALALGIKMQQYDHERQFYIVHLEKELQKGKKYVLAMDFIGYLNNQLRGFYKTTYTDADGMQKNLATTDFKPSYARLAFPCFDEPALKATFEIFLARETWMTSVANIPHNETLPVEGKPGWQWDRYQEAFPISTFQVGFLVSSFAHRNSTENDHVVFRVWARRAVLQQADYARQVGPQILAHLEDYLNKTFPLPKQDLIAVPELIPRGTEGWGITHLREDHMLYHPEISSIRDQEQVTHAVAYALAQQCLGDVLAPEWWDDVGLNQGLAVFMEYIGVELLEPEWKASEDFVASQIRPAFALDCLESAHEVIAPVVSPEEVSEISDAIADGKGSTLIRMMSHFLGDKLFSDGLNSYLNEIKNVTSKYDDLWESLSTAAHLDNVLPENTTIKMIMDTWTSQKGYPVIKVNRSPDGTSATITQERFRQVKNPEERPEIKWWVPLTYTTQSDATFNQTLAMVWMKDSEDSIIITSLPPKDEWVIFNLQQTGFYRVNYDDSNWDLLTQQLKNDHEVIHVINRAQIIDDAMNLARAGQLRYETALLMLSYLKNETEYLPWSAALNSLAYLESMLGASIDRGTIKSFLLDLVMPLYNSLRLTNETEDSRSVQHLQELAVYWACKLGHPQCLDDVVTTYHMWMEIPNNDSIISPIVKSSVYCHAIAEGGAAEWAFGLNQYLRSNVASEKAKLLYGLGCSKEVTVLTRYLEMAFLRNGDIRRQDSIIVFTSVAKNEFGRALAWSFLKDRWNNVFTFDKRQRAKMLEEVTYFFNTRDDLQQLQLFQQDKTNDMDENLRSVQQAVERTRNNLFWMASNYNTIVKLLETDQALKAGQPNQGG
ncbi:aminopeptidase N-like [Penaeus monodon]|uniref:aminopeptidase N-like n=1 Tax=Penaeus monodon TaxID=6687 RepID=UPI0018A6DE4E|nr:aminopeptidase N-like [Penaeus monodon]XP_037798444.1 aminopeptidase N-like [Penaeus monodon]XP_037798450.1 aminopeptidase N-like [Penaeus monodon]